MGMDWRSKGCLLGKAAASTVTHYSNKKCSNSSLEDAYWHCLCMQNAELGANITITGSRTQISKPSANLSISHQAAECKTFMSYADLLRR